MKLVLTPVQAPVKGSIYPGPYVRDVLLQDSGPGGWGTYHYLRAGGWQQVYKGSGSRPSQWLYVG